MAQFVSCSQRRKNKKPHCRKDDGADDDKCDWINSRCVKKHDGSSEEPRPSSHSAKKPVPSGEKTIKCKGRTKSKTARNVQCESKETPHCKWHEGKCVDVVDIDEALPGLAESKKKHTVAAGKKPIKDTETKPKSEHKLEPKHKPEHKPKPSLKPKKKGCVVIKSKKGRNAPPYAANECIGRAKYGQLNKDGKDFRNVVYYPRNIPTKKNPNEHRWFSCFDEDGELASYVTSPEDKHACQHPDERLSEED